MQMSIEKFMFIIDYYQDINLNLNILFYQTICPCGEMKVNLPINHIMYFDNTLYLCHYSNFKNSKTIDLKDYKDIVNSYRLEKINKISIIFDNVEYDIKKIFINSNRSVKLFYLLIEDKEFEKPKLRRNINFI